MTRVPSAMALAAFLVLALAAPRGVLAQETTPAYQEGARVEVDVNMSSSPEYQTWKTATVVKVEMWNGQVSGYHLKTDDGAEIVSASRFMRPSSAPAPVAAAASGGAGNGGGNGGAQESVRGGMNTPAATSASPGRTANADARSQGTGNCKVGTRVTDRENRSGVVVRADGPSCHVKIDGTGEERYYLQWMLTPGGGRGGNAGTGASADENAGGETTGALATGSYTCWAANGQAGVLRLIIKGNGTYSNEQGTTGRYGYDAGSGQITFSSGPWAGFYGRKLGPRKIGLSSRPGGFSNTVCDLK